MAGAGAEKNIKKHEGYMLACTNLRHRIHFLRYEDKDLSRADSKKSSHEMDGCMSRNAEWPPLRYIVVILNT